jgi:hypothetical protein
MPAHYTRFKKEPFLAKRLARQEHNHNLGCLDALAYAVADLSATNALAVGGNKNRNTVTQATDEIGLNLERNALLFAGVADENAAFALRHERENNKSQII